VHHLSAPPPPPRSRRLGGLVDDLVDPLVAQAQFLGDLPQRPAGRVQPADRVVIVGPRPLGGMLRLQQPPARDLGLAHQLRIKTHVSSLARQRMPVQPTAAWEWIGRA
jgi:hypothetical protein